MGVSLIVANQTLGGARLSEAIRERIERGHSSFHILVPMTLPHHEAPGWGGGFGTGARPVPPRVSGIGLVENVEAERAAQEMERQARMHEANLEEARRRAGQRLEQMIDQVAAAGGEADGEVGDADPVAAAEAVLRRQSFDEIIISTLPPGISRWLKMDLASRVARMTDTPVTTIEETAGA
jgi:hypothetical protein